MERFMRGGSLGRSLARNLTEGLNDHHSQQQHQNHNHQQQQQQQCQVEKPCLEEMQEFEGKFPNSDENSRISLRGSISRVLSFRQNRQFSFPNYKSYVRPIQSPTSSEYGSIVSSFSYRASSPPELETSPSNNLESDTQLKNILMKRKRRHRRAKSIGDITVTPV